MARQKIALTVTIHGYTPAFTQASVRTQAPTMILVASSTWSSRQTGLFLFYFIFNSLLLRIKTTFIFIVY